MLARIREFFISCSPLEFNLIARSTRCWRYLSRRYSRGMCLSLSLSLSRSRNLRKATIRRIIRRRFRRVALARRKRYSFAAAQKNPGESPRASD